ncbi:MAG: lipase family protein [Pseudomonadota bacterium]
MPAPAEVVTSVPETGQLLSQTDIETADLIRGAQSGVLIRYTSLDGLDGVTPIEVTGALYFPAGEAPEEGWPLIAWSHGTVGIADACAPSTAGRSERDLTYLSYWLERGYAIVASDYQGLGTPEIHPYMATRPMAYNTLDGIRAVQEADFPLTDAVVVTGQSQGASAAIATAGFAPDYAPEIDLRAISATGVPYFPPLIQAALAAQGGGDEPDPNVALGLYMLTLGELIDPSFVLKDAVDEDLWPVISQVYEKCVFDFVDDVVAAGLTSSQITTPETQRIFPIAFSAMEYPSLELSVPAFVGMGEVDTITPLTMQKLFVQAACEAGSNIEAREYAGAGHNGGLLQSMPDVEVFIEMAFQGETPEGSCQ